MERYQEQASLPTIERGDSVLAHILQSNAQSITQERVLADMSLANEFDNAGTLLAINSSKNNRAVVLCHDV